MISEAEYTSPDGALRFLVTAPDGDITMGFAGYSWHTHGDTLGTAAHQGGAEAATRRFIDDLLSSRSIIAVLSVGGRVKDVWITDDVAKERKWCQPGETLEFRLWDGTKIEA